MTAAAIAVMVPNVVFKWLESSLRILEIPGQKLGRTTCQFLRGLSWLYTVTAGMPG
jgi:hypothetical protein